LGLRRVLKLEPFNYFRSDKRNIITTINMVPIPISADITDFFKMSNILSGLWYISALLKKYIPETATATPVRIQPKETVRVAPRAAKQAIQKYIIDLKISSLVITSSKLIS
jgi:hypothetical protein